ncbi:uncharacterized protein LOC142464300 [Ascaphus truei]|uniref:uncharacterized protein LOC142464300 n=1 Tax=Ascaphus truei TaxID=8439 RepID=UPI003F5A336F
MNKDKNPMTETILNHTLEIIYLLTGEDYIVVKKHGEHVTDRSSPCVPEGFCRAQRPIMENPTNSLIFERNMDKKLISEKILEHTNKIIHLLTGEVPIKCDDVAVYLSMEEWEYLEGHKELFKDVMMENRQTFSSLDGSMSRNTPSESHTPLCSPDCVNEDNGVHKSDQGANGFWQNKSSKRHTLSVSHNSNESTSYEDGNPTASHIYTIREHIGAEYGSTHVKECGNGNTNAQEIHQCGQCGKNFNNELAYTIHQRTHTVESLYNCFECQKSFTSNFALVKHQAIHTGEKPFVCSECDKCFSKNANLVKHQRLHTGKKPFVCSECGKRFTCNSILVRHQIIHTGKKPFVCSECGKSFNRNSTLVTHQRIHSGDKLFVCSECGKCFTSNFHLVRHQSSHTGEKPFMCSQCGKCFSQNSNLVTHQRIHVGDKPFPCSQCRKCFGSKGDLLRHCRIHTGEKQFACSECGKRFTQNSTLVRHQRHHTENMY